MKLCWTSEVADGYDMEGGVTPNFPSRATDVVTNLLITDAFIPRKRCGNGYHPGAVMKPKSSCPVCCNAGRSCL